MASAPILFRFSFLCIIVSRKAAVLFLCFVSQKIKKKKNDSKGTLLISPLVDVFVSLAGVFCYLSFSVVKIYIHLLAPLCKLLQSSCGLTLFCGG